MNFDKSSYYPKSALDDDESPVDTSVLPATGDDNEFEPEHVKVDPESEPGLILTAISTFLSWALVPMFMPIYGLILAFGLSLLAFTGTGIKLAFIGVAIAFNVVVPAILVLLLKKLGFVNDVGLNGRRERFIPYIICILALVGTALFMHFKGAPQWLTMFFFGGAACGVVEVIINNWWKISVHSAGIAGIVALLVHLQTADYVNPATMTWLMISVGCAGLLGASRIWLGRHTLGQVLAGYTVGFCGIYFMML
ncbi:MAG: phosphatase PAP2 family protein [Muribaculaceae bacterium]|nr:phosphatase PAP2 family protein [Muribaculaceae bacterium]